MKVNEIKIAPHNGPKSNNNKSETSFRGVTDGLIKFWEAVDRGGLAASFTVQDMLGTNFPRTWAAKDVGKDLTGKNNWGAVLENGLREFLTGPSMFVVPGLVLFSSMKLGGKSNGVPVQTIKDFAEILENSGVSTESKELFKQGFYTNVLKRVFGNFDGIENLENLAKKGINLDDYVSEIIRMEGADKKGLWKNIRNVSMPDSKEEILAGIVKRFVSDKKANTTGYPDFLMALITDKKYISDARKTGAFEIKIDDLIDRMVKYSDDLFESFGKSSSNFDDHLKSFTKRRMGSRFATNILMGVFTAAAMWFIPKIYTVNKTNPETDPVRQKANELRNGQVAQQKDVSFSGGGISKLMSNIGDKVAPGGQGLLSKKAASLESNWINVARPIFYTLITCFTLVPRLIQSTKRDIESSKKNGGPIQWDETSNILRRDITTILTILFAMEGMGSVMGLNASKKSGIVLTSDILRPEDGLFRKFIKIFNPEGGVKVLSKAKTTAQMSNFANLDQLMRFFEKNQENNGNLYKLLHIDAKNAKDGAETLYAAAKKVFGEIIENEDLKVEDLLSAIKQNAPKSEDVKGLLDLLNNVDKNPLLKFANRLNAIFQTVSLAIVTGFLGFGLPKINDFIIQKKYLKDKNTLHPKYNDPNVPIPDYSILNNLKPFERETYQYFLGNAK